MDTGVAYFLIPIILLTLFFIIKNKRIHSTKDYTSYEKLCANAKDLEVLEKYYENTTIFITSGVMYTSFAFIKELRQEDKKLQNSYDVDAMLFETQIILLFTIEHYLLNNLAGYNKELIRILKEALNKSRFLIFLLCSKETGSQETNLKLEYLDRNKIYNTLIKNKQNIIPSYISHMVSTKKVSNSENLYDSINMAMSCSLFSSHFIPSIIESLEAYIKNEGFNNAN